MTSVCGVVCEELSCFGKECQGGCNALQGKPFWVKLVGLEVCPIYQCVKDQQFANCGACEKLPCNLWQEVKDPARTDEEHQKVIETRVARLRSAGI